MSSLERTRPVRDSNSSPETVLLAVLLVLGVVASAMLIFSSSLTHVRLGLVVALWAAIIGAIGMSRFRRQSVADRALAKDQQLVYELQLEREISARREFEMHIEARVRREVQADADEISELRAELAALRRNLERYFDGAIAFDRPTLGASETQTPELVSAASGSRVTEPESVETHEASATAEPEPIAAFLRDEPIVDELPSKVGLPSVTRPAPVFDQPISYGDQHPVEPAVAEAREPAAFADEPQASDGAFADEPASEPETTPRSRGQHASGSGNSVAEIIARLRAAETGVAPRRGRHTR